MELYGAVYKGANGSWIISILKAASFHEAKGIAEMDAEENWNDAELFEVYHIDKSKLNKEGEVVHVFTT